MDRTTVLISVGITLLVVAGIFGFGMYGDQQRKPFDATEVLRAVALAWHSWRRACDLPAPRKIAAGSEAGCEGRELARLAVAG